MAVTVNAAVYGVGVYGTARYGKVIVSNLDTVSGTGAVSNVQVNITELVTAATATGNIQPVVAGGFEIDVTERVLVGVSGTGAVNFQQVNVTEIVTAVNGTGTTVAIIPHADSLIVPTGVSGTGTANTVEEKVTEVLDSVNATGNLQTVQPNITEVLTAVSATGNVATVQENTAAGIDGVTGTGSVSEDISFIFTFEISSVSATGNITAPTQVKVKEKLVVATGVGAIGSITQTAAVFNFEAVKDLYSKKRTVYIPRAA